MFKKTIFQNTVNKHRTQDTEHRHRTQNTNTANFRSLHYVFRPRCFDFGFLPENFVRWRGPMNDTLSFYECRFSGEL